jgi:hypothetical protein
VAVLVPVLAIWVYAARRSPPPRVERPVDLLTVLWIAFFAAFVAWQLYSFFSHPRATHPTVSSLFNRVDDRPAVLLAAYGAWIWLGWELARR